MSSASPIQSNEHGRPQRLVLLGGGHSQIEVLRQFAMNPPQHCAITVVTLDLMAPYSGMLPGYVAGHYDYRQCHIDVRPLAKATNAILYHTEVDGLDLENRLVLCPDRPAVPFDLLSINIGSRPAMSDVPGAREFALPAKPVDRFIAGWQDIVSRVMKGPNQYRIVVVGGGAGGIELALTMHYRLSTSLVAANKDPALLKMCVVLSDSEILATHNAKVRRRVSHQLNRRGIQVHASEMVAQVERERLRCDSGLELEYDSLIWTTHASPQPWVQESGIATDDRGFLLVDRTLRSVSHPFVFAAGDIATMRDDPRPKSGVFAVRQGPYLADNLRHSLDGSELEPFVPQNRFLSLLCTGDKTAVASRGNWSAEGAWVWRWKDRIDRKFMNKYDVKMMEATATSMHGTETSSEAGQESEPMHMQCAGCGSKVGHTVLQNALKRLQSVEHHGLLLGLDAPDDAAVVEVPPGKLAVHTVDFFPALVDDPYLFGRIAANHCLSDIHAMGATPHTALAMATLPHGNETYQEDVLTSLLAGAMESLMAEHTVIAGGHTIEGDTLCFGLSVNGFIDRERLMRKGGLQAGDALILTKPLGTGVIFAADMRGKAQMPWLDEAIATMLLSNSTAAKIVYEQGATACTDITGFGLLGHLREMQREAQCDIVLDIASIPMMQGALKAASLGIKSSLFPHNVRVESSVRNAQSARNETCYSILFDPQTSGGLLAAVPADNAPRCIELLQADGYSEAAVIGRVTDASADDPIVSFS